jgi:hypothetical protein
MPIDIEREQLLPLADVPAWLLARGYRTKYDTAPSLRTVQEWAAKGLLEVTPDGLGVRRYTSIEALVRMFEGSTEPVKAKRQPTPRQQRRRRVQDDARASAYLDSVGW